MLLVETTIEDFIKYINKWNDIYPFNLVFYGQNKKGTAWTVSNVLITGIDIAPNRILCEFDNFNLRGTDKEARVITDKLRTLLHASFSIDNALHKSATYGIMERQSRRTLRKFPPPFADRSLDANAEADFKASAREKNHGITEEQVNDMWNNFCLMVENSKISIEDQTRRRNMMARDAAREWFGGDLPEIQAEAQNPSTRNNRTPPINQTTNIYHQEGQTVHGSQIIATRDANIDQVGNNINTGGGDYVAGDKNVYQS